MWVSLGEQNVLVNGLKPGPFTKNLFVPNDTYIGKIKPKEKFINGLPLLHF